MVVVIGMTERGILPFAVSEADGLLSFMDLIKAFFMQVTPGMGFILCQVSVHMCM